MDRNIKQASADRPLGSERPESVSIGNVTFEFDVVIVDGERGRRLTERQVESIFEVIDWFATRRLAAVSPPSTD